MLITVIKNWNLIFYCLTLVDLLLRRFPPTLVGKRDYLLEAGFYNFYILLAMVLAPSLILEAPKSKSQKSYCPLFKMKNKIFWITLTENITFVLLSSSYIPITHKFFKASKNLTFSTKKQIFQDVILFLINNAWASGIFAPVKLYISI